MYLYKHHIATRGAQQMSKVTDMVREDIEKSGVKDGIVVVFSLIQRRVLRSMKMPIRMWCMIC